jgi:mannose-6-phosphate isomerase-like protein (cupin superfamily)
MDSRIIAEPLAGKVLGSVNDAFVIAEWRDPGGAFDPPRYIAPLHLHRSDDESWYVLEGKLCVQAGNKIVEAGPGCGVSVARGTPHTYWNAGPDPLRYLLVMSSRIYRLIQEIHGMNERTPEAMRAVFEKYDSELLLKKG